MCDAQPDQRCKTGTGYVLAVAQTHRKRFEEVAEASGGDPSLRLEQRYVPKKTRRGQAAHSNKPRKAKVVIGTTHSETPEHAQQALEHQLRTELDNALNEGAGLRSGLAQAKRELEDMRAQRDRVESVLDMYKAGCELASAWIRVVQAVERRTTNSRS